MTGSNSLILLITFLTIPSWTSAATLPSHPDRPSAVTGGKEAASESVQPSKDAGDLPKEDHSNGAGFIKKNGDTVIHSADATDAKAVLRREPRMPHRYGPTPAPAPPSPPSFIRWDRDKSYCLAVNSTNISSRVELAWCGEHKNGSYYSNASKASAIKYMRFKVPGAGGPNQIQWSYDDTMCLKVKKDWVGNGDAIGLHKCGDKSSDLIGRSAKEGMMFTHNGGRKGEHGFNQPSTFEWDCSESAEKETGYATACLKNIDVFYEYLPLTGQYYVQMWDQTNAPAQLWHVDDASEFNGADTSAADR